MPSLQRPNVVCFCGENAFAIREERRRWEQRFCEKHGEHNLLRHGEGDALPLPQLLDEVGVMPFLAEKRLISLQGIPRWTKEEMTLLLGSIHPDVILLISEPAPDRRLGGVKALLLEATIRPFPLLRGKALREWACAEARRRGCSLTDAAFHRLLANVGDGQDILAQELHKLCQYVGEGAVGERHVEEVGVSASAEGLIWQMVEILAGAEPRHACLHAQQLLARGDDPFRLWNVLLWIIRSVVQAACLMAGGMTGERLSTSLTMAPQSARHVARVAGRLSLPAARELLAQAVDADERLKTGEYRASAGEAIELLALIDVLLLRLASTPATAAARGHESALRAA